MHLYNIFGQFCFQRRRTANISVFVVIAVLYLLYNFVGQYTIEQSTHNNVVIESAMCSKQTHFVYIKMIKCASTTLSEVFRRFGIMHNLSFVLPPKQRIYIGWPYPVEETLYRPAKSSGGFDILCDHAVYDASEFRRMMAPGTVYLTSIREPFSQFKSMINYYNVLNISGVPVTVSDRFAEFMNNLKHYESIYKSPAASKTRYCIPDGFSMTRNLMSFNLGFPTGGFRPADEDHADDDILIQNWINDLSVQFRLVMIMEYYHESVVLLRRLMCWELKDILFHASNSLSYDYRTRNDANLVAIYRNWSRVDYALYQHFNKTFWQQVSDQDRDFWLEVKHFRQVNTDVNNFCSKSRNDSRTYLVRKSAWNDDLLVTAEFCKMLSGHLLDQLQSAYDSQLPQNMMEKTPLKVTC